MKVVVLDAPSNLGLRPGPGGAISGVDRLAATVRAAGLLDRLRDAGAEVADAGGVQAGAYDISEWEPGHAPYNAAAISEFTVELADRVEGVVSIRGPEDRYSTTVEELRAMTPATAAGHALDAVLAAGATDVWVHVDADVIDPEFMPAVDSPEPGGLEPDELVALLQPLLAHPSVRGIDLCIYDPALDSTDAPGAALLASLLGRVFARAT